jgi:uroporphyrinogen decarboxylase
MSPQTWREFILPGEKLEYDLVKNSGKHVVIHSCGRILRIIPDLIELGVDVLNPVQSECMDLGFLKETYGDKLTFWGGVSTQKTLPYGTPDDVRKETEQVIKLMSKKGGYITCPSQVIQEDVPYENLKALIETARFFG